MPDKIDWISLGIISTGIKKGIIDETIYASKISYVNVIPSGDIISGVVKDLKSGMGMLFWATKPMVMSEFRNY